MSASPNVRGSSSNGLAAARQARTWASEAAVETSAAVRPCASTAWGV